MSKTKRILNIESKNYSLTQNKKEYEVIEESENYYTIENDKGKIAKYHKSLFKIAIKLTESIEEIMESLKVTNSTISFIIDEKTVSFKPGQFSVGTVNISCGIRTCNGLNDRYYAISTNVNKLVKIESVDNKELIKLIFYKFLARTLADQKALYVLFSTNRAQKAVVKYMDELEGGRVGIHEGKNPNSHNIITLWTYNLAELKTALNNVTK